MGPPARWRPRPHSVAIHDVRGQSPPLPPRLGQDLRALCPHGLEVLRVQAEQEQDGRGDLGNLDRGPDDAAVLQAGHHGEDRHVAILGGVSAVLGDLALPGGVDDTVLDDAGDVGVPGIADRDAVEGRRRSPPRRPSSARTPQGTRRGSTCHRSKRSRHRVAARHLGGHARSGGGREGGLRLLYSTPWRYSEASSEFGLFWTYQVRSC